MVAARIMAASRGATDGGAQARRTADPLAALDGAGISRHQIKIMFVSGMGFLADAYDLFVIGIVVSLLKTEWALSTSQVSWLNSATLAASAVGALVFGRIADIIGRRRVYGFEVLILAAGALASAFAPNFTCLLISRIVLGIGVGGDYPVSATIMSEYAGKRSRGRLVGLVFAMQGAGLVVGPLAAAVLLGSGISHGAAWRILLALGAVPALSVFYLRRRISETPRFALAAGAADVAGAAIAAATTARGARPGPPLPCRNRHPQSIIGGFCVLVTSRVLLRWLVGTACAWCLLDFAYYGNTISSPQILRLLSPHATLLHNTLVQLTIFAVFALPGYFLAIALLDKTGRRSIQLLGFGLMGAMFLLIGLVPGVTQNAAPFLCAVRDQLLLHRVRPEHHHIRVPGRALPGPGPHHRARHLGCARQAGRVRGRVPVPRHAGLVAGHPRRRGSRRARVAGRTRAHRLPAARAQGQEPGGTIGPGLRPAWPGARSGQGPSWPAVMLRPALAPSATGRAASARWSCHGAHGRRNEPLGQVKEHACRPAPPPLRPTATTPGAKRSPPATRLVAAPVHPRTASVQPEPRISRHRATFVWWPPHVWAPAGGHVLGCRHRAGPGRPTAARPHLGLRAAAHRSTGVSPGKHRAILKMMSNLPPR